MLEMNTRNNSNEKGRSNRGSKSTGSKGKSGSDFKKKATVKKSNAVAGFKFKPKKGEGETAKDGVTKPSTKYFDKNKPK